MSIIERTRTVNSTMFHLKNHTFGWCIRVDNDETKTFLTNGDVIRLTDVLNQITEADETTLTNWMNLGEWVEDVYSLLGYSIPSGTLNMSLLEPNTLSAMGINPESEIFYRSFQNNMKTALRNKLYSMNITKMMWLDDNCVTFTVYYPYRDRFTITSFTVDLNKCFHNASNSKLQMTFYVSTTGVTTVIMADLLSPNNCKCVAGLPQNKAYTTSTLSSTTNQFGEYKELLTGNIKSYVGVGAPLFTTSSILYYSEESARDYNPMLCVPKQWYDDGLFRDWRVQKNNNSYWYFFDLDTPNENIPNSWAYISGVIGDDYDPDAPKELDDEESTTGGGGGNFDSTSDSIGIPALPSDGTLSSGMLRVYQMTNSELASFAHDVFNYTNDFFDKLDDIDRLFKNPLDLIVSVYSVPFSLDGVGATVSLAGVNLDTTATKIENRFKRVKCGSYELKEYFGNALDYTPYTKIQMYVPYHGYVNLSADEVQNTTISLDYNVDIVTGTGIAMISVNDNTIMQVPVNLFSQAPLTSSRNGDILGFLGNALGAVGSLATANVGGVVSNSIGMVSNSKTQIEHGSGLSGNVGCLGFFKPHLIIERPILSLPKDYRKFKGYPCNITYTLSDIQGYTQIDTFHTNGINATKSELDEIANLFKDGVIL